MKASERRLVAHVTRIEVPAVEAELLGAVEAVRHYSMRAVHFPADLANGSPKVTGPERHDRRVAAVELPLQLREILLQFLVLRDRRMMLW